LLQQGDLVEPKIRFKNKIGFSEYSNDVQPPFKMQDLPHAPSDAPTRHEALTFGVQIGLSYPALSGEEAGGAEILSYNVAVDLSGGGSGPWTTNPQGYESDDASLVAVLQPLTEGQLFYFKYRAKNAHGWGPYSPIVAVWMANKPD
jgi:hypothetical protein